jgi:multiple antibiotic resistance protein
MQDFLHQFLLAFIPLFVAVNTFGIVPMFLSLTEGMDLETRKKLTTQATFTAFTVAIVFIFFGKFIFSVLGITEHDFRVGGGIVLMVIAVSDILFAHDKRRAPGSTPSVVPLGIPLMIGPAALTTILLLVDTFGFFITTLALVINLIIVWVVFRNANIVIKIMGRSGARAFAKVASLFLAAIAVRMVRLGLTGMLK